MDWSGLDTDFGGLPIPPPGTSDDGEVSPVLHVVATVDPATLAGWCTDGIGVGDLSELFVPLAPEEGVTVFGSEHLPDGGSAYLTFSYFSNVGQILLGPSADSSVTTLEVGADAWIWSW